ncbi:sensor histidine kinase [Azospirillum agricola]|uniref:sensor histidine kinase n=1 Tax=Azospirillum agricola TaxID=1720247 RepID=UPI000A0F285E|nr:sensor histidine kinase [Azospirillum agricola]SMH53125.1 His Kinase A (phospho-acceptor) domain-containing protein [Azospirillum lipoferum]
MGRRSGGEGEGRAVAVALRRLAFLLLLVLLPALGSGASALADGVGVLRLTSETKGVSLSSHFGQLVDPGRSLTFEDVLRADAKGQGKGEGGGFVPRTAFRGAGQTRDIHWYRFDLLREPGAPATWIMELGEAYIDHLDLHVPIDPARPATSAEDFRVIRMGDFVPYSQRPMQSRLHATPLDLPEGRVVTVYLRVDSVSAITLYGTLWTSKAFVGQQTRTLLFQGMFLGVLAILVLGYGALGVMLQDTALLAYTGHIASALLYYLFANGIAAALQPDAPGWLMNLEVGGTGLLGSAMALILWDRLLDLRRNFPRLHRVYLGAALFAALLSVTSVMPSFFMIANPLVSLVAAILTAISLVLIVLLIRRNPRDVILRFYLASTLTAVIGISVAQVALRGGIPLDWLIVDPYQLGSIVAFLILGAGLTLRIRRLQTERVRAEQETLFATTRAEEQRTFIAMLSHEFRTPLASIDGAAQMIALTGGIEDPGALKRLDRVRATTRKLADLVEMFLSSQALDQGALALNPEPVALGTVIGQALDGLAVPGGEARLTVTVEAPNRPLRVDSQFLGVAVTNLVQNALRYSPPDTTVFVEAREEEGGVAIRVTDHGRGMSAEEVARIGTIYFRAASSRGTKGSGIGLYMTHKIVAAHGGTLTVDSVKGSGSVFTIRLRDDVLGAKGLEGGDAGLPLAAQ